MFEHFARTARVAVPRAVMPRAVMAVGTGLLLVATLVPAQADPRSHARRGMVTAESHFGKGTVTGAVREGRHGLEVQLPGGSWIGCGRNCSDMLRRQSVDFWENQANGPDKGRGYLSWGRSF